MKIPNFFIVGQPKSGTTALYHFLKQHPTIYVPEKKELHHFERDFHETRNRLLKNKMILRRLNKFHNYKEEDYLKHFENAKRQKILVDITPNYLYSKKAAKAIHKFNPKAKILAIFREPISFVYSLHSQYVYDLIEHEKNFEKAISLEKERKKGTRLMKSGRLVDLLFYGERVKYEKQLKRYLEVFPKEQIKVIIFDDLIQNNEKTYYEILNFLEVKKFKPDFKIVNPNKRVRFEFIRESAKFLVDRGFGFVLPKKIRNNLENLINKITTKYQKRKKLDANLIKQLKKRYKPEVVKFNKLLKKHMLIKRDLVKLWGYDE